MFHFTPLLLFSTVSLSQQDIHYNSTIYKAEMSTTLTVRQKQDGEIFQYGRSRTKGENKKWVHIYLDSVVGMLIQYLLSSIPVMTSAFDDNAMQIPPLLFSNQNSYSTKQKSTRWKTPLWTKHVSYSILLAYKARNLIVILFTSPW